MSLRATSIALPLPRARPSRRLRDCDDRLVSIQGRFSKPVFPGDTIVTKLWKNGDGEALFETEVDGREGQVVVGLRVLRIGSERLLQGTDRLLAPALLEECEAERVQELDVVGLDREPTHLSYGDDEP